MKRQVKNLPPQPVESFIMDFDPNERNAVQHLATLALEEDLGANGDLTSLALIPPGLKGQAMFVARGAGSVAGIPAAESVYELVDHSLTFIRMVEDGAAVEAGTKLAIVSGKMRSILTGERTALNFLQHMCGVATQTRRFVALVAGLPCKILDTRKTTPGWRLLEKYAVRCGGGYNHRMGLHDAILIKDNHLAAIGPQPDAVAEAVKRARDKYDKRYQLEVEVDNLDQLNVALQTNPDIVLLDNMSLEQLREAVRRRNAVNQSVLLEASGGVNLSTVRAIAETGVDHISVGALTHSAVALDIALDYLS
jgi:nicotinate-nucleotide pyrophosphorylase (carboxylating)